MIYEVELLIDQPTKTYGRIYNKKMVSEAITAMRSSKLESVVTLELDGNVDIYNSYTITHIVRDLYIENDTIMANLEFVETPSYQMFMTLSDAKEFEVRPIATGCVHDSIVKDYTLHRLGIFFD